MVREKLLAHLIVRDSCRKSLRRWRHAISIVRLSNGELSLWQLRTHPVLSGFSPCCFLGHSVRMAIIVKPPPVGEAQYSSPEALIALMAARRQVDENGRVPATQECAQLRQTLLGPQLEY